MKRHYLFFAGLLGILGIAQAQDWWYRVDHERMHMYCNGKSVDLPDKAQYNLSTENLATKLAIAVGNASGTVLEIRKQSDGSFHPVLAPERLKQIILKTLEDK